MRSDADPVHKSAAAGSSTTIAVDGVVPPATVAPVDATEVAVVLADAAERGLAVAPVGGATALALGNPPARLDLALSTANLGGVIDYEPTDLVLAVGAGARLGDVQAVLAEHGQALPIDPPGGAEATIGGLIATALTGPRRLGAGSLRDLLIGISVAHPSGTVTKAGGMVVKNVSGFDLTRVYHGSLGTLGVIVSANFKVLPMPRAERSVLTRFDALETALEAAAVVRTSRVQPAALEVVRDGDAWLTAARVMGREETVRMLADDARELVGGGVETLDGPDSAAWWAGAVDRLRLSVDGDEAVVRCSVRPRETSTLALGLIAALAELGVDPVDAAMSVGLGTVTMRVRFEGGSPERLSELQGILLDLADNATILAAPPEWKRGIDVWGRRPEAFDVMRALKEQFDPGWVLNPGRFVGHI